MISDQQGISNRVEMEMYFDTGKVKYNVTKCNNCICHKGHRNPIIVVV